MYARRRIVNLKQTQRVTGACANSPPRIRRIPHRESADFLTANSPTSPPRIPHREFADLSLSLANIDQWIRGESMANVRPIICVIGEYHSSRIRRIKFVWIRGEYSPRKFQMNSTVSQSIPNRFACNFAHTIRSHCGDCPENLVRFNRVFQKLLMWCTETTLFPHRQSAENAGRHWNSTEEVPSPHRTCVTEQLELTRQVARNERVIINTTSTQAQYRFFFFFF